LFVNLLLANRVHLFLAIASVKPYIYIYVCIQLFFDYCWLNQHIWACQKIGVPRNQWFSGKMAHSSVDFLGASFWVIPIVWTGGDVVATTLLHQVGVVNGKPSWLGGWGYADVCVALEDASYFFNLQTGSTLDLWIVPSFRIVLPLGLE
jgi:hypothetical protein